MNALQQTTSNINHLLEKKINYLKTKSKVMDSYRNYNLIPLAFIDAKIETPKFKEVRNNANNTLHASILKTTLKYVEVSLYFPQIDWKFTRIITKEENSRFSNNDKNIDKPSNTILSRINETKISIVDDLFLNTYSNNSPLLVYCVEKLDGLKKNLNSIEPFGNGFTRTCLQTKIVDIQRLIDVYQKINRGFYMLNHYDDSETEINKSFSLIMRTKDLIQKESEDYNIELDKEIKNKGKMSLKDWFR